MGIPLSEEIVEKLRQEKRDNYENGVDTQDNDVYMVGDSFFRSDNLKQQVFEPKKRLREVKLDEMSEEETNRMKMMAKMVDVVYKRRMAYGTDFMSPTERKAYKEIAEQNVGDYIFENTENDLTGRFINNNNNEAVLAFRGLLPHVDRADLRSFGSMTRSTLLETDRAEGFGSIYQEDKQMFNQEYFKTKKLYPTHKIVTTGHSRGSRGAIHLGRKHGLEFHAFSPVGNRADYVDSVPHEQGYLYYNNRDPTSMFIKSQRGKTIEQHHSGFNKKLNPHSLTDFYDDTKILKHKKLNKKEIDEFEKELLLDIKSGEQITGEDYVDSDLGKFDDVSVRQKVSNQVATIPRKDVMISPMRNIYTGEIIPDKGVEPFILTETLFDRNVFNDLNLIAPKPFEPDYFEEIDSDKNNEIDYQELFNYLNSKGYSKQDIDELFYTFDFDKDGKINRREFYKLKQRL